MTDFKASDREVNRAIRSWLHQDRHEDVSRVAGAVLDEVETIPQRRAMWWPAWRAPIMNKVLTYGLGAAAVVLILVVGAQYLGSPNGLLGAHPTPTAMPTPTLTPEPSPTPVPSPPPLNQSFTSTLHGYSVSYPEGWLLQPATEPWTKSSEPLPFTEPDGDRLYDPVLGDHLFLTVASQRIADSTPEDWVAQMASAGGCTTTEPITVDGATGLIGSEGCDIVVVTSAGRGYWISLNASDDEGNFDPAFVAAFDRTWFDEVLATVQLHPDDAVD